MIKITIDEREIEVPAGTKIIEAAARLRIMIPRFCYHPALGSVGACRVCAVKFAEGPVKGIQMSCMIEAADGMVVSTTDAEAVDFRRHVIEWLMLHHPHDCPVCDEGGHCLLQDMTVAGGHGIRRYPGRKRTYIDQDLGPLVQHEMNRCIHCYRCVRFYQEFCGYRDLGALRLGNRTFFGRVQSGVLESPFTGNLSDLCPTGVFTDKPSRFFGRRWDYQRGATLCINCSLGCHTVTSARYRQVARQEARFSPAVNGHFICDRGRYGFFYTSPPARPRQALVDGSAVTMEQALLHAHERLDAIVSESGPAAVAAVGSTRSSLENLVAIAQASVSRGWRVPAWFADRGTAAKVQTAVSRMTTGSAMSLKEIEAADAVLVIGADPLQEAPMLALSLRQAARKGARVVVLDPRPVSLPCEFTHIPERAEGLSAGGTGLIQAVLSPSPAALEAGPSTAGPGQSLLKAAADLQNCRRWAVVCGTDVPDLATVDQAAEIARLLSASGRPAGLFYLLPGANAFAAGLLTPSGGSLRDVLEEIESGKIRALIVVEADPFHDFPDRGMLQRALSKLDFLLVLDYIDSRASAAAQVFLPTQTVYESGGLFINQEGRLQESRPVFAGGTPIRDVGRGDHPPRDYAAGLPGADPRPAWEILARLAGDERPQDARIARERAWRKLAAAAAETDGRVEIGDLPDEGLRLAARNAQKIRKAVAGAAPAASPGDLEVVFTDRLFGTEELSKFSACLEPLLGEPQVALQQADAARLGIADAEAVSIGAGPERVKATARVFERMAAGVIVVPRDYRLSWQTMGARIRPQDIGKV